MAYSLETSSVKTIVPGAEVSGFCDVVARQKISELSGEVPQLSAGEGIDISTVDGKTVITNNISAGSNISLVYDMETNTYRIDSNGGNPFPMIEVEDIPHVQSFSSILSADTSNLTLQYSYSGEWMDRISSNYVTITREGVSSVSNYDETHPQYKAWSAILNPTIYWYSAADSNYQNAIGSGSKLTLNGDGVFPRTHNSYTATRGIYTPGYIELSGTETGPGFSTPGKLELELNKLFWGSGEDNNSITWRNLIKAGNTVTANSASWGQGGGAGAYVPLSATECEIGSDNYAKVNSLAQGTSSIAYTASLAQGNDNFSFKYSLTQGEKNQANNGCFAQGYNNSAENGSIAQGSHNSAKQYSIAQGWLNSACDYSFTQGQSNYANGSSMSQGQYNSAFGESFTQGLRNSACWQSMAQGERNISFNQSLTQGTTNSAVEYSQALGDANTANKYSFAAGNRNFASRYSQALGYKLNISGGLASGGMAIGSCNKLSSDVSFVVGNGTSTANRSDAFVIYPDGRVSAAGKISANGVELGAGGGGHTYTGVAPIQVNNSTDEISITGESLSAGPGIDMFSSGGYVVVSSTGKELSAGPGIDLFESGGYFVISGNGGNAFPITGTNGTTGFTANMDCSSMMLTTGASPAGGYVKQTVRGVQYEAYPAIDVSASWYNIINGANNRSNCYCIRFTNDMTAASLEDYSAYDKVTVVHSNQYTPDCMLYWNGNTKVFPSGLYCELVKGTNDQNQTDWFFTTSGWINNVEWDWD